MKITIDTKNDSKEEILKAIELIHHIIHNPSSNCLSNNSPSNNVYSDYSNSNDAFNFSSNPSSQQFSSNLQSQPNTNQQSEFDIPRFSMNDTSLNNNSNNSNISNSSNYNNYPTNSQNNYSNTPNAQNTPNIQPPQPTVYNTASNSNQPLERPIQQITPFNALFGDLQTSNLSQQNPQNQQSQQSIIVNSFEKETIAKPSTELKREKPKFSVMGFETY